MDESVDCSAEEDIKPTMLSLLASVKVYPTSELCANKNQHENIQDVETPRKNMSEPCSDMLLAKAPDFFYEEAETFEDFYQTQHYTLICRISDKFYESIEHIMDHRAVGMAFEGQNLGRHGTLSLIQIATSSGIIIFDIIRLGTQALEAGLRALFESEDVMKIVHDCRWIADLLRCQHKIALVNVFDTQVADAFVRCKLNEGDWPRNVYSLSNCLNKYLNFSPQDINFSQIGEPLNEKNKLIWLVRPLSMELLKSAANNAAYLLKLQRTLLAELLVEFKAAVDIYLNYCSGVLGDLEKCRETSCLLPQAFKSIHTCIGGKSQCEILNQIEQQNHGSGEFGTLPAIEKQGARKELAEDSIKVSSECSTLFEPVKRQERVKKKKKIGYKMARKILLKQLQKKVKSNIEMSRDALPSELLTLSVSDLEGIGTDLMKSTVSATGHIGPSAKTVLNQEFYHSFSFSGDANISANILPAVNEKETKPGHQNLAVDPKCVGILRLSVSSEGAQTTELVEESTVSPEEPVSNGISGELNHSSNCSSRSSKRTERSYKCGVCNEKFLRKKHLTEHKKYHVTERTYNCPVCGKTVPARIAKDHKKLHPPHRCDLCGLHFARIYQLKLHQRKHRSEIPGPFQCDDCGKTFFTKSDLLSHKVSHSDERHFECDICGKAFKTSRYLRNHRRRHAVDKPYVCEYCGKSFAVKDDLFAHTRRQHEEIFVKKRLHKCNLCGEIFPNARRLRRHTLNHSGQRPHVCDVCSKGFALAEDLTKHKAIHTGIKPYKCNLCKKSFIRSTQLKVHNARVHLDHKTFHCNICDKWFGIRSDLNQHTKIHT